MQLSDLDKKTWLKCGKLSNVSGCVLPSLALEGLGFGAGRE
jgi:hypothetical protein